MLLGTCVEGGYKLLYNVIVLLVMQEHCVADVVGNEGNYAASQVSQ